MPSSCRQRWRRDRPSCPGSAASWMTSCVRPSSVSSAKTTEWPSTGASPFFAKPEIGSVRFRVSRKMATAIAFGGPRSSCVCPGTHYAQRQDSRNDLAPCRMALPFVSAGAHAPHSDKTPGPTATRGTSHSARRLRSLAFLCSSGDGLADPQGPPLNALHEPHCLARYDAQGQSIPLSLQGVT